MTQPIDANELLRRIINARDWAAAQEAGLRAVIERQRAGDATAEDSSGTEALIWHHGYAAARRMLDEIIEPGTHTDDRAP